MKKRKEEGCENGDEKMKMWERKRKKGRVIEELEVEVRRVEEKRERRRK